MNITPRTLIAASGALLVAVLLPVTGQASGGLRDAAVVTNGAIITNGSIVGPRGELRVGPWSPDDRASVSPDGTSLAYPRIKPLQGPDDVSLRVLESGGEPREVWSDVGLFLHQPVWSPDGTQLAVATMPFGIESGPAKVWLVPADGSSDPTLLLDGRRGEFSQLAWSADGSSLYYPRYGNDIFRYDLGSQTFHQVTGLCTWAKLESPGPAADDCSGGLREHLAASPDGTQIVTTIGRQVQVVDASSGDVVRTLADLPRSEFPVGVAWAPDGGSIAYARLWWRSGRLSTEVVPATGGSARVVADSAVSSWQPCPEGDCPVLGEPRTEAKVSVSPAVRGDDVDLLGRVRPVPEYTLRGQQVAIVLQKQRGSGWATVKRTSARLEPDLTFAKTLRLPTASTCRAVVSFPGSWYLTPARAKRSFSC